MSVLTSFFNSHCVRLPVVTVLFVVGLLAGTAIAGGMGDDIKERMGVPLDSEPRFQLLATSPTKNYTEEQRLANAPDILSVEAAHIGVQRLLFRVKFAHPVRFNDGSLLHFYLDLDNDGATGRQDNPSHQGVDVMITLSEGNVVIRSHNPAYSEKNVFAGGTVANDTLYVVLEAPLHGDEKVIRFSVHLLAERYLGGKKIGQSDSTPRQVTELARQSVHQLPPLDRPSLSSLTPLTAYRYIDTLVKYETLENKGLTHRAVVTGDSFTFGRPRPFVPFVSDVPHPDKAGTIDRHEVQVSVLEEAGVERREAPVTFGFPLPLGGVYDLEHFRLLSPNGGEMPAQFTATSLWPDDSLKWVLVDFTDRLSPHEERTYSVEFGNEVRRNAASRERGVVVQENDEAIIVTTGPLRAQVGKNTFKLLDGVWIDADGDGAFAEHERVATSGDEGVGLVDEHGVLYTTSACPPDSVLIEEFGSEKVVIRAEGAYGADNGATYMRYVTRLTFRAGSARVNIAHTHINDYLKTEFTDITSLYMPFETPGPIGQAEVFTRGLSGELKAHGGSGIRMFLSDEKTASVNGEIVAQHSSWVSGMIPGVVQATYGSGAITAVVHDFQERWPKGLAVSGTRFSLELLPEQPNAEYGTDLPFHLMFPFVSGKYRSKWGNSFTERITIDFASTASPEEMAAEGRLPVVAIIPPEWYAETNTLGPIPIPAGERMAVWDRFVSESYLAHLGKKTSAREFGYLNYGDWFGERGRNWGNNEYDLAHGLFMEFVRTGDRRYHRLALAAARHQADVDIIHAYPDPAYVGANAQHSIGHTGVSYQEMPQATWSKALDVSFAAANGHTWADGMMDAWLLAGEARVMEAALALGEHIVWSMAPDFRALGTHERSAGWSLKALMALYRGTHDPAYMEAARHIASVALKEQDLKGSGVWPHPLPTDHSGNRPGTVGNNLYLMGILLGGLQAYHAETDDPDVLASMEAAVEWVVKSWDPQRRGWPYSAAVDGEPLYVPSTGLNTLVVPAIAYVGSIRNDDRLLELADAAIDAHVRAGTRGDGKSLAQTLHFSSEVLGRLSEWRIPVWIQFAGEVRENALLRGQVPLGVRVLTQNPDDLVRLSVALDGEEILAGTTVDAAESYVLDTLALVDGLHELAVSVVDRTQGQSTKKVPFRVRNWWNTVDELRPPIMAFGFALDRLQVEEKSEGWEYAGDRPEVFLGDPERLTRAAQTEEYLIWSTPLLQECEATLYAKPMTLAGGVVLAVSEDGTHWRNVSYETQVVDTSQEGWQKVCLRYVSPANAATHWLRLTFTEALASDVQLGRVAMKGLLDGTQQGGSL